MFPGYLFLRHALDKSSYIEVRKTRGLVCVLGERWDCLAEVPDSEVEAVQKALQASIPVFPHAYLQEDKGLLVLSVDLLRRSVAVEVDCTWAVAA
jgi:transcription antitermination factor NusG